jgi:hypothetical protein
VSSVTPLPLFLGERARVTHWIGGWIGPRACLDVTEMSEISPLQHLAGINTDWATPIFAGVRCKLVDMIKAVLEHIWLRDQVINQVKMRRYP